jgi:hypothetical protein
VDPDLWECAESPLTLPRERIADELAKQWYTMLEKTGTSLKGLAKIPIDIGEDQMVLDKIAIHLEQSSNKMTLEVNPDQEKLPTGIEERGREDAKDEDEEEEEEEEETKEDDIPKKTSLNDVLSRLIPEFVLLSDGKDDLQEAMETIYRNPTQRKVLNEFLIQLYG